MNIIIKDFGLKFKHIYIYQINKTGKIIACNENFLLLLNETQRRLINYIKIWELFRNQAGKLIKKNNYQVLYSLIPAMQQEYYSSQDEAVIECIAYKIPLKNTENIQGLINFSVEASAFDRDVSAIAFDHINANLPGHVYWKNKEGVYLGCNNRQAQSLGLKNSSEVSGKTDFELPWPKSVAEKFRENDIKVMESGEALLVEESSTIDGHDAIVISHKIPLKNNKGKIVGLLGMSIDISKQKTLEKELIETKAREARFKAMAALGGMVAHEMRTPLASLKGTVFGIQKYLPRLIRAYEICEKEGKMPPTQFEHLSNLKESISRMDRSISHIQYIIRSILANTLDGPLLNLEENDSFILKETIAEAVQNYIFNTEEEDLVSIEKIDDVKVKGKNEILIHVIHNLLKNALHEIKANKKGKIRLWSNIQNDKVHLHFKDTAGGINPKILSQIFEPFFTTKKESSDSIGIGLYFCKTALRKMLADITCKSVYGKYTQFTVSLSIANNKTIR